MNPVRLILFYLLCGLLLVCGVAIGAPLFVLSKFGVLHLKKTPTGTKFAWGRRR